MAGPQAVDGQGGGGVAGHHQRVDPVHLPQPLHDGLRPLCHPVRASLAVGRVQAVGQVGEAHARQLGAQGPQHAQAADPAVEHADMASLRFQADATVMPLNSPLAMRFCHSAGPVMCALVPPASTATVTGMSTTSNS